MSYDDEWPLIKTFPFAWHPDWKAGEPGAGHVCYYCDEEIGPEQLGLWVPYHGDRETPMKWLPWHRLCFLRSILPWHPDAAEDQREIERNLVQQWKRGEL